MMVLQTNRTCCLISWVLGIVHQLLMLYLEARSWYPHCTHTIRLQTWVHMPNYHTSLSWTRVHKWKNMSVSITSFS